MRTRAGVMLAAAAALVLAGAAALQPAGGPEYTKNFRLWDCQFLPIGANPYWTLQAGKFRRYEGMDGQEFVELEITVLPQFKLVTFPQNGQSMSVLTRVIEEREWVDGELVEVSRNYFSRDLLTRNVFYFGEDVDIYENGKIVSHDGAWLAGVNGAKPGLIMPSVYLLGSRYFQEIAPGVAMDRGEHTEMGLTVTTPAGTFTNCVMVRETSPLEPGHESIKIYAPKVGLIDDSGLKLVEYN